MRRTNIAKFVVAAVATLFVSSSVFAQQTLQLTLEDALKVALSENNSVKVADMEIQKAEYAKKGTYASLFPQVDFSGTYQRAIKKQVMVMQGQEFTIGVDNTWSAGFSAALPLVNAELWKALEITGMDVELAVEKAQGSRQDLIDQVQQAMDNQLPMVEVTALIQRLLTDDQEAETIQTARLDQAEQHLQQLVHLTLQKLKIRSF